MPVSAVTLKMLMDAGLNGQALIAVVASIDADMAFMCPVSGDESEPYRADLTASAQPAKTANALRQARFRAARRAAESVTQSVTRNALSNAPRNADEPAPSAIISSAECHESPEYLGVSGNVGIPMPAPTGEAEALQGVTEGVTRNALRNASPHPPLIKKSPPAPPKEINPPLPPEHSPALVDRSGSTKKAAVIEALSTVLDVGRSRAVVDHRQAIRKPLTVHAAELLAGKLAAAPDPNAAADAMVANGWQGFEVEWLERRNGGGARASPEPRKTAHQLRQEAAMAAFDRAIEDQQDEPRNDFFGPDLDFGSTDYRVVRDLGPFRQ